MASGAHPSTSSQRGWSFLELVAAMAIVGTSMLIMLQQMTISYRETGSSYDKVFAYQKALAMIAEIQSSVERGVIPDSLALEELDDLGTPNAVLTTLEANGSTVTPDHVMSSNWQRNGKWLWWRVLSVDAMQSDDRMRYVRITIKRRGDSGRLSTAASIGAVVNLPVASHPKSQVHDVYAIAIAEAPSLSDSIESMRSSLDGAIASIRASAPGLEFRVHWITKMGYGRDPYYIPYLNSSRESHEGLSRAFWYPSNLGGGERLYTPELFSGRIRTDAGIVNDYDVTNNPEPHAVADRFNHAMRSPRARRVHNARVLAGLENVEEPPLQLLLDDMWANPEHYRNAIFVNLHGEALPCPPVRNYSDAAKLEKLTGVRAVTHPERIWTPRDPNGDSNHADTQDMHLRVYAYETVPSGTPKAMSQPITLQILGVDLSQNINQRADDEEPATLWIRDLHGGVDRGGSLSSDLSYASGFQLAKDSGDSPESKEMYFEAGYVASPVPYTWIRLHNTPLGAPLVSGRGLGSAARLYGMDYIPSPITANGDFSVDLSTVDTTGIPKNTARWRITIPNDVFQSGFWGGTWANTDTMVDVVTRIGTDLTDGTMWPTANEPRNYSETYSWWSSSSDAVPPSERYQFLGDPRHNPYGDLAANGASFPHGYNWFFDDFSTISHTVPASHWPCFDFTRLSDGGVDGNVTDEPRLLWLWRQALLGSGAIWSHGDGLLAGATVLGSEVASPPATASDVDPRPLLLAKEFFDESADFMLEGLTGNPGASPAPAPSTVYRYGSSIVVKDDGTFWAKPWLGEFAPDDYSRYRDDGNLETSKYEHILREHATPSDLPAGTSFAFSTGSRCLQFGGASLLQSASGGGPFVQTLFAANTTATYAPEVHQLLALAGTDPDKLFAWRYPFELGQAFTPPGHWSYTTEHPNYVINELERMAECENVIGGSVLSLEGGTGEAAYFAVNGMTPRTDKERMRAIAQALVNGVRAFHVAGAPPSAQPVDVMPTVTVTAPSGAQRVENPASFVVRWEADFVRFDGADYTSGYGSGYTGDESQLGYVVLVSTDEGATWKYGLDGTTAEPGVWLGSTSGYWLPDAGVGAESFVLPTPEASYPQGQYLIRVECYHATRRIHYAFHQQTLTIERVAAPK